MGVIIRPAVPEDIEQIKICAEEVRGQDYYSGEHFESLFSKYELFAAVCENNIDLCGIFGVTSGIFNQEKSTMTMLNIRNSYSGQGIGKALITHVIELLRERRVRSIKGNSVTWHTTIQRVLENMGFRPTGILRGIKDGKNVSSIDHGIKHSLAIYALNVSVEDVGTLYVPEILENQARSVYASVGVKAAFANGGKIIEKAEKSESSVITHYYADYESVMYIQILECGDDLIKKLSEIVESCTHNKEQGFTVLVMLNIESPTAIYGFDALGKAGYQFNGFDILAQRENAVFYCGKAVLAKMKTTERLEAFCRENGLTI